MSIDVDAPKFWDEKKQKVFEGVEIRKTPTQLDDILGTYVFVYSGDPEFSGDVEEMYRSHCKDDAEFITTQSITLAAANQASEPVAPENVTGHVTWGTAKVAFDGVRRVRERWSSDAVVSWMESYWEVLLTEDDDDSEQWLDLNGNAVGAAVVLDDNGFPFLVFDWSHPYACHGSWSGYYVGKRLVEGKKWQLSHEERGRLGIGKKCRSMEQFAKEGSPGEDSEESNPDEEDVDSGESSGEDEVSEDVGEKRKASNSETGANKRRRA